MSFSIDYTVLIGEGNPLKRFPELKDAALNEFSQNTFDNTSLNNIIKNGGISKGSLYHHFGDKFGLYIALMDLVVKKKREVNEKALFELKDTNDLFETLDVLIGANTSILLEDRRISNLYQRFLQEDAAFRQRLIDFLPQEAGIDFADICIKSVNAGKIDKQYPPSFIQGVLGILLNGFEQLLPPCYDTEDILLVTDLLQKLVKHGLSPTMDK